MDSEVKIIPDQKLAVINYKGPIEDLDILVSKLVGWVVLNARIFPDYGTT